MRRGLYAVLSIAVILAVAPATHAQDDSTTASHWDDFAHYVLIAKPDLALGHGTVLLQSPEGEFLEAVEAGRHKNPNQIFIRAAAMPTLKDLATQLAEKLQAARIKRAREPERIRADIQKLSEGARAYQNAMARLRAAGQFAVPHLLKVLQDDTEVDLHRAVLDVLVDIGRDAVYPLCVALKDLEPVQMGVIAEKLAEIGYPRALPYLKEIMEDKSVDPGAQSRVARSFNHIASKTGVTSDIPASALFFVLGQNFYKAATNPTRVMPGTDPLDNTGVVWVYDRDAGLIDIHVPRQIFGDVLALRAARRTLKLDPSADQALSLFHLSNLRRENRMPEGGVDKSYPSDGQPARFYASASDPARTHDVLDRALTDSDPELARDAIAVLSNIAGTNILINDGGAIQPILRALNYPGRRVRYETAMALIKSRPDDAFLGSNRVVTVLSDAVRQTADKYALVIATSDKTFDEFRVSLAAKGYKAFGGKALKDTVDELNVRPGVDVIVTNLTVEGIDELYGQTIDDVKLATVPIIAVVDAKTQIRINQKYADGGRVFSAVVADDDSLKAAVEHARSSYSGAEISPEEAGKYASGALTLLREVALGNKNVYNVLDAQPALVQALTDERQNIVKQAGGVLALLDSEKAQRSLADAALDTARPSETRVSLLNSVAENATHYGTRLDEGQLDGIHKLIGTATGDLALAAARAYGALAQPTDKVVEMLIK